MFLSFSFSNWMTSSRREKMDTPHIIPHLETAFIVTLASKCLDLSHKVRMTCKTLEPAVFNYFENCMWWSWSRLGQTRARRESLDLDPAPPALGTGYKREQISQSYIVTMLPLLKFLLLALICCSSASLEEEVGDKRSKRLFYVSTTSSTSTLKTQTICYKTSTAASVACTKKRKKRSISSYDSEDKIDPTGLR